MDKYWVAKQSSNPTLPMLQMQKWVERYICGTNINQGVVGKREDDLGIKVTQLMFTNKNRWAHVCPFIRDSLDYDEFWIEESDLINDVDIETLLLKQIGDFKNAPPAHDPIASGQGAKLPILWKTFLTFFPRLLHRPIGGYPLMDNLHAKLKPVFIQEGLMLGQFYARCPAEATWNPMWKGPLISPWPAFAIRYMAKHDHIFLKNDATAMAVYNRQFFP
jgi:hypothetical protein